MLSGSHVHAGDNARQVMVRAATEPARSLASAASDVPAAVCEWLEKALQFDKLVRWESAAEMRAAGLHIQRELFGPSEPDAIRRLFELRALDIAHSPTELSLTSALSSAVHELDRSPLRSQLGAPGTSPSLPALRLDGSPVQSAHSRRSSLALIGLATLGIALAWGLSRPKRPLEISLSAAIPSTAMARAKVSEGSTPAAPALNRDAPAPVIVASSASARTWIVPASTSPSSAVARRSGATTPSVRVRVAAVSAAGTQPSALPSPAKPAPTVAPKPNPLQIDLMK
jgi:hypothetical protein